MPKISGIPTPEDLSVSEVMLISEAGLHIFSLDAEGAEGRLRIEAETGQKLGEVALADVELFTAKAFFVGLDEPRTISELVRLFRELPGHPGASTQELKQATQRLADTDAVPMLGHNFVRKGQGSAQVTWLTSDSVDRSPEGVLAMSLLDRYQATQHSSAKDQYDNFIRTGELDSVPPLKKLVLPKPSKPKVADKPEEPTVEPRADDWRPIAVTSKTDTDNSPEYEYESRLRQQETYPTLELERQLGGLKAGESLPLETFIKNIKNEAWQHLVERELDKWIRQGRVVRQRVGREVLLIVPKK